MAVSSSSTLSLQMISAADSLTDDTFEIQVDQTLIGWWTRHCQWLQSKSACKTSQPRRARILLHIVVGVCICGVAVGRQCQKIHVA